MKSTSQAILVKWFRNLGKASAEEVREDIKKNLIEAG